MTNSLRFTHEAIDGLQRVMATHGFAVPVRVISDAFHTTMRNEDAATDAVQPDDAAIILLREVGANLEAVGCGACVGSMAPMEDLHGRIVRFLAGAAVESRSLEVSQAAVEAFGRAVEALTTAHPNVNPWSYKGLECGIAAALAVHLSPAGTPPRRHSERQVQLGLDHRWTVTL